MPIREPSALRHVGNHRDWVANAEASSGGASAGRLCAWQSQHDLILAVPARGSRQTTYLKRHP